MHEQDVNTEVSKKQIADIDECRNGRASSFFPLKEGAEARQRNAFELTAAEMQVIDAFRGMSDAHANMFHGLALDLIQRKPAPKLRLVRGAV